MKFYDIKQDENWLKLRKGKFTASEFGNLFMGKSTKGYKNTIYKVVFERLTNEIPETFKTDWMQRGNDLEDEAKEIYENQTFNKVKQGGFYCNDWFGASPDGHVRDGLIEIKCPKYSTFIEYLIKKELPKQYFWQVHFQMYCSKKDWVDFVAYHPGLPLQIIRISKDPEIQTMITSKIEEVKKETKKIIELCKV